MEYGREKEGGTMSEEEKEAFLDTEIHQLVFRANVDENFIVDYFDRINSGSKQLSSGEHINTLCRKPIVETAMRHFFSPSDLYTTWCNTFGQPSQDAKRMNHLENTIPYLTSSMHGPKFISKSYPVIAPHLKGTSQEEVDTHMSVFQTRMGFFMEICRAIFEECPQLRVAWTKQGLPPLRQISAIWLSILEPQHIENPLMFWPVFYRVMMNDDNIKNQWELYMRKNGKAAQLYVEIEYAKNTIN